jgi:hypothetical protein
VLDGAWVIDHVEGQSLGDAPCAGPVHFLKQHDRARAEVLVARKLADRLRDVLCKFDVERADGELRELFVGRAIGRGCELRR